MPILKTTTKISKELGVLFKNPKFLAPLKINQEAFLYYYPNNKLNPILKNRLVSVELFRVSESRPGKISAIVLYRKGRKEFQHSGVFDLFQLTRWANCADREANRASLIYLFSLGCMNISMYQKYWLKFSRVYIRNIFEGEILQGFEEIFSADHATIFKKAEALISYFVANGGPNFLQDQIQTIQNYGTGRKVKSSGPLRTFCYVIDGNGQPHRVPVQTPTVSTSTTILNQWWHEVIEEPLG